VNKKERLPSRRSVFASKRQNGPGERLEENGKFDGETIYFLVKHEIGGWGDIGE
jgi:hypothetical protein